MLCSKCGKKAKKTTKPPVVINRCPPPKEAIEKLKKSMEAQKKHVDCSKVTQKHKKLKTQKMKRRRKTQKKKRRRKICRYIKSKIPKRAVCPYKLKKKVAVSTKSCHKLKKKSSAYRNCHGLDIINKKCPKFAFPAPVPKGVKIRDYPDEIEEPTTLNRRGFSTLACSVHPLRIVESPILFMLNTSMYSSFYGKPFVYPKGKIDPKTAKVIKEPDGINTSYACKEDCCPKSSGTKDDCKKSNECKDVCKKSNECEDVCKKADECKEVCKKADKCKDFCKKANDCKHVCKKVRKKSTICSEEKSLCEKTENTPCAKRKVKDDCKDKPPKCICLKPKPKKQDCNRCGKYEVKREPCPQAKRPKCVKQKPPVKYKPYNCCKPRKKIEISCGKCPQPKVEQWGPKRIEEKKTCKKSK